LAALHTIIGMPGTGKTQLAGAYARERIRDKWRLVAWINADTPAATLNGLIDVATALAIKPGSSHESTARALRNNLEADGQRCLLVFDNAPTPDAVRPYLPVAGGAHIIVTSTHQAMADLGTHLPVNQFMDEESLTYLRHRTGLNDDNGAKALAEQLGYLPLALAHAAAVVRAQHLPYATYLQRLRDFPIEDYLTRPEEDPYPRSVSSAILMSMQTAQETDLTRLATPLLRVISLLSPSGVTRDLLAADAVVARIESELPPIANYKSKFSSPARVDAALAHLAGASLLTYSIDNSTVTAHPIITRVVRGQLIRSGDLLQTAAICIAILQVATATAEPVWQERMAAKHLTEQITSLHATLTSQQTEIPAKIIDDLIGLREWALRNFDLTEEDPEQAIAFGQALAADCERILGATHLETLTVRANLAFMYRRAGRINEAIPLNEQNLAERERTLGIDHPDTIVARGNLAQAYQLAGRKAEALSLFEQDFLACTQVLGSDHPSTLNAVGDLCFAYLDSGQLDKAIPIMETLLTRREERLGNKNPMTVTARNNLADAYRRAGRAGEAIPMLEQALADSVETLGSDHLETLTVRNNLAAACQAVDRIDEAIGIYRQVISQGTRVLSPDHPLIITAQDNLAHALAEAGNFDEAINQFQHNVDQYERILGRYHPRTLESRFMLAEAYHKSGAFRLAIPIYFRTVADSDQAPDAQHDRTLAARANLARAYQEAGDSDKAMAELERAHADAQRIFGPDNALSLALHRAINALRTKRNSD
jgi:tetratricopeptide (TPR) repeat protein